MEEPSWNRGPNVQFYSMVKYIAEHTNTDLFYYMEGDSIPLAANWLDDLSQEILSSQPLSVLGGRYAGHNWDPFPGDAIIKPALRNHLNGNGVYNVSHRLLRNALNAFEEDGWELEYGRFFLYILDSRVLIGRFAPSLFGGGEEVHQCPLGIALCYGIYADVLNSDDS